MILADRSWHSKTNHRPASWTLLRCARLFPMINGNLRFGAWSLFGKQFFFSFFISSSFRFHVEIRLHFLIFFYAASLSCWFFVAQLIEFKLQPWWSWWLLCLGAFIVTLISVICRVSSLRLWYRESTTSRTWMEKKIWRLFTQEFCNSRRESFTCFHFNWHISMLIASRTPLLLNPKRCNNSKLQFLWIHFFRWSQEREKYNKWHNKNRAQRETIYTRVKKPETSIM